MIKLFNIFILLISLSIFSQETTGVLKGTILDYQNKPVSEALILIKQKSTGTKYSTQSQSDGYFEFNQLKPANDYEATIIYVGFKNLVLENISIL